MPKDKTNASNPVMSSSCVAGRFKHRPDGGLDSVTNVSLRRVRTFKTAKFFDILTLLAVLLTATRVSAQESRPWLDSRRSPDERAQLAVAAMTLEEQVNMLHGPMALGVPSGQAGSKLPPEAIPGAGYVPGVPRLGLTALYETDASLGVAYIFGMRHDGATALPSGLAMAASWNPQIAYDGGATAGQEAWRSGFNVLLGGGIDLARDPRNGRNFEYLGEDPLLAGQLAGAAIRGTQDQHVVSTIKHYAMNDQETGRTRLNANVSESAARESDLLAFEIAIERAHPGSVMCSYNRVNGIYACENDALLNGILKRDWGYAGWVMSDWGAVHSVQAALHGLDQESGEQLDRAVFFDQPLLTTARGDPRYARRVADMARRVLRSLFAVGAIDHPPQRMPIDFDAGARVAQRAAEQGIVLLRNQNQLLPLGTNLTKIAVIGGHADMGVLSGGGSAQVAPPQGPALTDTLGGEGPLAGIRKAMYMPSAPLKSIRAQVPGAEVVFDDGRYPQAAAELAQRSDIAIVFVGQWMMEGEDVPDLSLPAGQDELVMSVAAANPRTIVVLETGGAVAMPWLNQVGAIVEAWYPGIRGGSAIADILFGKVNPAGHLPITFPAAVTQLPRPAIPGWSLPAQQSVDIDYTEGSDVGYRWFAKTGARPLFPFGFGLSYTTFAVHDLKIARGRSPHISFSVENSGSSRGTEVAQVYLMQSPQSTQQRLLGWARIELAPGASGRVSVAVDPRLLASWDAPSHGWRIDAGKYTIVVGSSATDAALTGTLTMAAATAKP
jgi:beta-glucosidase